MMARKVIEWYFSTTPSRPELFCADDGARTWSRRSIAVARLVCHHVMASNAPFLLGHEEAIKQRPTIPATALSITLSHGVSDLLSPAKPIPAAPNCTL
jgi:hypothetical protein